MIDLDISRYIELKGKGLIRIEFEDPYFIFYAARFDEITGEKKEVGIGRVTKQMIEDYKLQAETAYNQFKLNISELLNDIGK